MKKTFKVLTFWFLIPVLTLAVAAFSLTLIVRYPNPVAAYQLAQSVPSEQPDLMPTHVIPASVLPTQLEVSAIEEQLPESFEFEGQNYITDDLLRATATKAFLVIRDGVITFESYSEDFSQDKQINTMSMGKTMVGMAIGNLIADGLVREQEPVTSYLPQYAFVEGLDQVTIKHLLDMQSCIGIDEDYPSGPAGWGYPVAQLFATTDIDFVLRNNLKVVCEPGSEEYEYRSVNTQLLGMVVTQVSGMSLSNYFGATVWERIGASGDASWAVDREGGWEKSFCCFNATARDLALIGGVFLNEGRVAFGPQEGQLVISEDWHSRMTTPAKVWFGGFGSERFGANMWHRPDGSYLTQGYRGQFMLMNPKTNTIVVKLSDDVENKFYDQVLALLDQIASTE